ncbi:fatty acid desaturase [Immundisolibacter sp.]|uniref:fatty acid desaturase n=1 Tax=Immundisolibacter sp. TaxID=1934948 RepID=UPI002622737B|nr:fatty acid desaturase [Immundisolibacter sp.]MDD3650516.1 fatty acid desaturase [Immundisolibacter sp.]
MLMGMAIFGAPAARRRSPIPGRLNLTLAGAALLIGTYALVGAPLLIHRDAVWTWTLLVPVLATPGHWALIHEAVHGLLHRHSGLNECAGRLLGIVFGAPLQLLRCGHLLHHRFNRSEVDRPDLYEPGQRRPAVWLCYYWGLLQGLYVAELLGNLLVLLPDRPLRALLGRIARHKGGTEAPTLQRLLEHHLLAERRLRQMRHDAASIIVLYAAAAALYGDAWPWLLAVLAGRGLLVSFLDNAYHYATAAGVRVSGHDLRLARPLARLVLNANLHGTHHRHPGLPWTALPAAVEGHTGPYLRTVLRQLRGPLPVGKR